MKTREYWRARFNAARQKLTAAQEWQHLAQDELSLADLQEKRELASAVWGQRRANSEAAVEAKQIGLGARIAATDQATRALKQLEEELEQTGLAEEWSRTD
jgi:hypothetical protein